ncbi:protein NLRC5 [Kryptolebias marmoratus]|uniref:protein NLRC5 n=1 Tax=Kryptolebias marmoratus TaxID=37003 RepID=UPI0018AC92EC|nr:protein NLRC5 [Kryptolebias marmoratus]
MACTSRSALDYIRDARPHLVGELRNLSVILENLYQEKVLTDEEVSKIKTEKDDYDETRAILDSVIKKGEAACYKLLRIIDTTRKRAFERSPLPLNNKRGGSAESIKFDLHHWISCFSFKEDAEMDLNYLQGPKSCHRYQKKLKLKAQKLSNEFWMTSKNIFEENKRPDLSYTPLVLCTKGKISTSKIKKLKNKKSRMSRPKKLRTYVPEDKSEISPTDLLKTGKNMLLVGKPGIGKTALTHEMLRLWSENDNKELDYMFYFDMRETTNILTTMSLEDFLFNEYSEPEEDKDEVLQDIKRNSENVTIIFDGITDLSSSVVKKLVEKDLLPDAKIIITCRPDDEEEFFLEDCLRVDVNGFSEQAIRGYLSTTLGEEHQKVLSNLELLTLCHVPMYALMVAANFSSEDSLQPKTISEIYINVVRFCLHMNSNKTKTKNLNSFIKTKSKGILSVAEAAFNATQRKSVNLENMSCEDTCVLSILKQLHVKVAPTETTTTYAFLHYTMQEFFAALWLLKNPDKIRSVFQQCLTEEMKHLIPFICRLLNEKPPTLMSCLIPAEEMKKTSEWFFKEMITTFFPQADSDDSDCYIDILFLCQCLFESQSPEASIYLLDKLNYCLDLSGEKMDPYSCCAVAFVVSQSKERKICLNLHDVTVAEQGMRSLFGCLENVQMRDPLLQQLWRISLFSEGQMEYETLLHLDENQLHLPAVCEKQLFGKAVKVMQRMKMANVCLYWNTTSPDYQNVCEFLFEALPYISSLRLKCDRTKLHEQIRFLVDLFCAAAEREQQTGEKMLELLSSVCRYKTFPLDERYMDDRYQSDFLLDLFSQMKDCETKTGLSLLPSLQSVFQSAPSVWTINLSERKTSILLEVLKLQSEKKQVKLTGCSHEESEVRSFLQCLPYISQLSFEPEWSDPKEQIRFLVDLFCAAAEREQQTGEKMLELLSSVCRYKTFPLDERYMDDDDDDYREYQSDFLLDLFSQMKDCETKTGLSLLPSLQSVFQSAPSVWTINLSERKTSILLEVLKLQSEKKQVKLTGCPHEESEVRSFLQCLPYISQLSCDPGFFQRVCTFMFVRSREENQQMVVLLQLLQFNLLLTGELNRKTCSSVGRVLQLCGSKVDLILTANKMSVRGAAALFRSTTQLHSLRLSISVALFLSQWVRRGRVVGPERVEELSLVLNKDQPSQRVLSKLVSGLVSLLRFWTVRRLDLTESCLPAQSLITLLLHEAPLTVKLSDKSLQQLLVLLHEIQDEDLTLSFLSKVGGDLSSCCLNWELLHFLLQQPSAQTITVNLRKNRFLQERAADLLPFLDRIIFKSRLSPIFVETSIREIYRSQAGHMIPGFLRSLDHVINLSCRELNSEDCAALLFILRHSEEVKLKLLWTFIPTEGIQSILFLLHKVSDLSVDRKQLLRFIHCCAASDSQQVAASGLLRTLQHSLDLSCSSCVDLPEEDQTEPLVLTAADCRAVSSILRHSSRDTQLHLRDLEVEDSSLDLLFPVLDRVYLRVSKTVLVQLLSLLPVNSERDTVRRAVSFCRALGGDLDLSHTSLDQRLCGALVQMLDSSEGLTELDLSHCQLTDQLLLQLVPHLHKVHVLDLSHNKISDASTDALLQLVSTNPNIGPVRLFSNNIRDRTPFKKDKTFEIW